MVSGLNFMPIEQLLAKLYQIARLTVVLNLFDCVGITIASL